MVPVAPLAQKKSGEIKTRSPTENFVVTQFSRKAFCFNRATDLLRHLARSGVVKRFWQGFKHPVCQLLICGVLVHLAGDLSRRVGFYMSAMCVNEAAQN